MSEFSQLPQEEIDRPEELLREQPEVIANPRLDNTKLLVSIPTWHGEWQNGVLVRSLHSLLSQKMGAGQAMEVNYVFNVGDELPVYADWDYATEQITYHRNPDPEYWERRKIASEALGFLRLITQIQADPESYKETIDAESDELKKGVLELAARHRDTVAVSVVNALDVDNSSLGYVHRLSGHRTMGLDYAGARLDDDAAFLMFDTDAVPENNRFGQELIDLFDANPKTQYMMLRVGFQPPGVNQKLVATGPEKHYRSAQGYSMQDYANTSQIVFRRRTIGLLNEIVDLKLNPNFRGVIPGEEDRDTAMRVIGLYADVTEGLLFDIDWKKNKPPVALMEDRVDGVFDGAGRSKSLEGEIPSYEEQLLLIEKLEAEAKTIFELGLRHAESRGLRDNLEKEFSEARKVFYRKQERNLRFNRRVLGDFLGLMDPNSTVVVGSSEWIDSVEVKQQISELPNGRALLTYLTRNRGLIEELSPEDVAVMRYCVEPGGARPGVMDHLSDFQKSMIEYLGYMPGDHRAPVELHANLQHKLAELLAYSHVHSEYFQHAEFYRDDDLNENIRESDQQRRESILNYQPAQANRDLSWLASVNPKYVKVEEGVEQARANPGWLQVITRLSPGLYQAAEALWRKLGNR